jgi:hypothetical protein
MFYLHVEVECKNKRIVYAPTSCSGDPVFSLSSETSCPNRCSLVFLRLFIYMLS